ncbi:hypothetical protein DFA_10357 [Cavenderia fasciculata]|uniref:Uncharacterized protein n=1 Tax=Cavenderia fasciculata TaxID=261658 RepID=F4Q9Z6_CACFS|nr:uncharacterized protein DFA_10357 [Cavenderia fasciculata]EGG15515.1 hypothetical protein DFA_10357 [Cavenderia fasciculata]|eukprot:XP_004354257.1 hypothetical protein DFA_10357 [Cavenderia fasciculata]
MATDYSCLNIIRKMHKEAKDGKKNHFTKTHSFILIPFFKRILSSVSPFHTASQLRDFGFKFANGAFSNANKHAKQYGPGRNIRAEEVSTPIRKLLCPSIAQAYAYYVEFIAKKYKDCSDKDEKTPIHRSTFYKFVPADVKIFNNRTDTCPYCHRHDVLKMYMGSHEVNYELDPIRFTYKFLSQKVKVGQEIDIKRGFKEVGVEEAQVVKLKQRMVNATKIKLNIQSSSSSSSSSTSTEQYDEKTRISELKLLTVKQLKAINETWTFRSKALLPILLSIHNCFEIDHF